MTQEINLGKWIRAKYRSQVAFAEKLGVNPTMISRWMGGAGISDDYQARIRKLGYDGPWPAEEVKEAPAPAGLANEVAELRGTVDGLRKDLRQAERVQTALIGAVRQLAKAANLPHLAELLE